MKFWYGSGPMDPDSQVFCLLLFEGTYSKIKSQKDVQKNRNQCFSYYFCLMIEGSGSGRPKNIWILPILIRNTVKNNEINMFLLLKDLDRWWWTCTCIAPPPTPNILLMLLAPFGPAFRYRTLKLNSHNCRRLKAIALCLIDVTEECLYFFSFLLMDESKLDILKYHIRWPATGNH